MRVALPKDCTSLVAPCGLSIMIYHEVRTHAMDRVSFGGDEDGLAMPLTIIQAQRSTISTTCRGCGDSARLEVRDPVTIKFTQMNGRKQR
ncbi:hypothetical protein C8Q70DRAFT_948342 [Cubamyces menziesii]|nr:hypothetical protein C8Q70DRAFT_948342 [Cubamyces menziesii]